MKKITLLTMALATTAFVFHANGQAKKRVLLEVFTGTWCGPCASKNPATFALVDGSEDFRCVSWHLASTFGGTNDPFYHGKDGDEEKGFGLYGGTGTPTYVVDGKKVSSNSTAVSSEFSKRIATSTPVRIYVEQTTSGTTRNVTIQLTSVGAPPSGNYTLRAAVVERDIQYTGSNGEKNHPWVFRTSMPAWAGTAVVFPAQGSSNNINLTYDVDPSWDDQQLEVIAWIQNTSDKEIINVGSTYDTSPTGIKGLEDGKLTLGQNYPNPSNNMTIITMANVKSPMTLEVIDITGKVVMKEEVVVGTEVVEIATEKLNAGVYLYRLKDENNIPSVAKRMQVIH